jgi:hypothetical protein
MRIRFLVLIGLLAAACGGAGEAAAPSTTSAVTTTVTSTTAPTSSTTAAPAPETEGTVPRSPNPDREPAPDFTLELSDGTVYASADEVRPVYMVFWAEW